MAKIEMDLSEYQEIQKNKELLEKSLERERELQEQLNEANKEKIEALEAAKMKVVKINRTHKTQYALIKREPEEIVRRVFRLVGVNENALRGVRGVFIPNINDFDAVIESFFDVQESISEDPFEEITVHGLDEVKKEIRKDLEAKIDGKTKNDLKDFVELQKTHKLLSEVNRKTVIINKSLEADNKKLDKLNADLAEDNKELREEVDNVIKRGKSNAGKLERIRGFASDASTRWGGKMKLIGNIYDIINADDE
jgi:hypothetical protein